MRQEVEEIEAALARIAEGSFGVCEGCGRALGQTRLLAEPVARLCHACRPQDPLH
jgi:RNA polymerase-binding transcription factor DksA